MPVNPTPIEGPQADELRKYGADPVLGRSLINGVSDVFRVVAFDYEGHVLRRPKPTTLTADNVVADLLAIADAAQADRFAYYGYSWLGMIGLQLAVRTPRLEALIMGGFPPIDGPYAEMVTTVNLAAALGLEGLRVLVIDLDSQGHATEWLGTKKQTVPSDASAYTVLTRRADIASTMRPTEEPGVMLCPAHELLARAATELGANLEGLFALKDAIDAAKQADLPIDVIVVDNPPAKTPVVFNALMGADLIIAPVLSHGMSLEGLADLYDTVRRIRDRFRMPLPDPRVLINDYTGQSAADRQIRDYLYQQYTEQVFQTIIGRDAPLRECFVETQSIYR